MMAGESELGILANRMLAQVAQGRYPEARCTLAEYCRTLRETLAGRPPGDAGAHRLKDEWQRLLEEMRRRVLAGRAHAAARLVRLPKLPLQYCEPTLPRHTWRCSG